MSLERAVEIIEKLVDGIHPLTGEILLESNICEETGIVDALNCAIQVLNERIVAERAIEEYRKQQIKESLEKADKAKRKLPDNAGKPWLPEDDAALLKLYKAGVSVTEIAKQYKRTKGAIRARLVRLGMADHRFHVLDVYEGIDPIDNDDLRYRLLHGETIPELAQRYGRTEKAIRARLFYMGFGGKGPVFIQRTDGMDCLETNEREIVKQIPL